MASEQRAPIHHSRGIRKDVKRLQGSLEENNFGTPRLLSNMEFFCYWIELNQCHKMHKEIKGGLLGKQR